MRPTTSFIAVISILVATTVSAIAATPTIPADEARAKAIAGEVIMIDVRSFEELAESGLPDVAMRADMYAPNFVSVLTAIQALAPDVPLALMCRRGDCAASIADQLSQAGVTNALDVLGGYYGTREVKGWSLVGLPIRNIDMSVSGLIPFKQP